MFPDPLPPLPRRATCAFSPVSHTAEPRFSHLQVSPLQPWQHFPHLGVPWASCILLRLPRLHSSKHTTQSAGTGCCTRLSLLSSAREEACSCCLTGTRTTPGSRGREEGSGLSFLQPAASQVQVRQGA